MICRPFKEASISRISQFFGANPLPYQPNGHTGVDFVAPYGTFLVAPERCKIVNIITTENAINFIENLRNGFGVVMLGESGEYHLYWHCLPVFPVVIGQTVEQGEIVAEMGNSGFVLVGGQVIDVGVRNIAPYLGTHLHQERYVLNGNKKVYLDPLLQMDFSIPITYDFRKAMQQILTKIGNILKGR